MPYRDEDMRSVASLLSSRLGGDVADLRDFEEEEDEGGDEGSGGGTPKKGPPPYGEAVPQIAPKWFQITSGGPQSALFVPCPPPPVLGSFGGGNALTRLPPPPSPRLRAAAKGQRPGGGRNAPHTPHTPPRHRWVISGGGGGLHWDPPQFEGS